MSIDMGYVLTGVQSRQDIPLPLVEIKEADLKVGDYIVTLHTSRYRGHEDKTWMPVGQKTLGFFPATDAERAEFEEGLRVHRAGIQEGEA